MQNPTILLWMIQSEREREFESLQRARLAREGIVRRGRLASLRRSVGLALVRLGVRLLPRDAASLVLARRVAAAAGAALPGA